MVELPKQHNYELAFSKGLEKARTVSAEDLLKLGVERARDGTLKLRVLESAFVLDLNAGSVTLADGGVVHVSWTILALHYLISAIDSIDVDPSIGFAQMPDGMGYVMPYQGRVIQRFLHTAGRSEAAFREAARKLSGEAVHAGDAGYRFAVFPTFPVTVIWHAGDEELPSGATMLYTADADKRFSVEDIVVMSELLVGRLSGKGW